MLQNCYYLEQNAFSKVLQHSACPPPLLKWTFALMVMLCLPASYPLPLLQNGNFFLWNYYICGAKQQFCISCQGETFPPPPARVPQGSGQVSAHTWGFSTHAQRLLSGKTDTFPVFACTLKITCAVVSTGSSRTRRPSKSNGHNGGTRGGGHWQALLLSAIKDLK